MYLKKKALFFYACPCLTNQEQREGCKVKHKIKYQDDVWSLIKVFTHLFYFQMTKISL